MKCYSLAKLHENMINSFITTNIRVNYIITRCIRLQLELTLNFEANGVLRKSVFLRSLHSLGMFVIVKVSKVCVL